MPEFLAEGVVVAAITFVGGGKIDLAVDMGCRDGIWLVHAGQWLWPDNAATIFIAWIEAVAYRSAIGAVLRLDQLSVILVAKR